MPEAADLLTASISSLHEYLPENQIDPEDLSRLFRKSFEDVLGVTFFEGWLTPEEEALKEKLLREKYQSDGDQWNRSGKFIQNNP